MREEDKAHVAIKQKLHDEIMKINNKDQGPLTYETYQTVLGPTLNNNSPKLANYLFWLEYSLCGNKKNILVGSVFLIYMRGWAQES